MGVAHAQQAKTIESCAALLPKLPAGQTFHLSITGTIDTQQNPPAFKGDFKLSDGTLIENAALQVAAKPFVEGVAPLLK